MALRKNGQKHSFYRFFGKRFFDVLLSGGALVVLSPLLAILALLVRVKHGSPIFFTPTRPGKDEKIFRLYKFRTMTDARDKDGMLLPETERLTKLGKFLRATSLDEIPELINIFIGDMSIVGPRPFAMKYLPYYYEEERVRHSVRPGLTGLAQITGRNNLLWPQRFEKDLEYVREMSLGKDLSIIFGTVRKVFGDSDVMVPDAKRMPQFDTYRVLQEEAAPIEPGAHTGLREVGGGFWLEPEAVAEKTDAVPSWLPALSDSTFTLSGRAAINLALSDAMSAKTIKTAYVPSYLPFPALQPFVQLNIKYFFYDVDFENGSITYHIDKRKKCDVFFAIDYFGIDNQQVREAAAYFKKQGSVVIEDITHTLLNKDPGMEEADYLVASIRKWFAVPSGGWLAKREGSLSRKPNQDGAEAVEDLRNAMLEKYEYMIGHSQDKVPFLERYVDFESKLVQLSSALQMDPDSRAILENAAIDDVRTARKNNARFLYDQLAAQNKIRFLQSGDELEKVTPLYVPILLNPSDRNSLRKALLAKGFYCPIHWPEHMGAKEGFRSCELSLPCDQRYTETEMKDLADAVLSWCRQ